MEIKFDNKYRVFKRSDLEKYLTTEEIAILNIISNKVETGRIMEDKSLNEYLVINTDESYIGEIAQILKEHGHCSSFFGIIKVKV